MCGSEKEEEEKNSIAIVKGDSVQHSHGMAPISTELCPAIYAAPSCASREPRCLTPPSHRVHRPSAC